MAIAFVNSADLGNNSQATNNLTASYTVGSGNNRLLVVGFVGDLATIEGGGGNDDITGVTYAGAAMIFAGKVIDNTAHAERYTYLYFLLNPASGANNVVISCTNIHWLIAVAADYTGVAQIGQPDATTTNFDSSGAVTSLTTSITTIANNSWAILLEANNSATVTAGAGATFRVQGAAFQDLAIFDSNNPIVPAGPYNMTTNVGISQPAINHIIASFAPAVGLMGQIVL